eukprot:1835261-Amphidinium_carterae.3
MALEVEDRTSQEPGWGLQIVSVNQQATLVLLLEAALAERQKMGAPCCAPCTDSTSEQRIQAT